MRVEKLDSNIFTFYKGVDNAQIVVYPLYHIGCVIRILQIYTSSALPIEALA